MATQGNSLKSDNDNVRFGLGVLNVVMEQIARYRWSYLDSNIFTISVCMRTKWKNPNCLMSFLEGLDLLTFGTPLIFFDINHYLYYDYAPQFFYSH